MHVLFVHKNFPAQFGHIARYLIDRRRFRCTFVSEKPPANLNGLERIPYRFTSGATDDTHLLSRTFVNQVGHSHGLFEALEARPDIQPDLIVAHSGFVSPLYLRELYTCPIVSYFEFFLRARTRNAFFLLDLHNCDAGYAPTEFQRRQLPAEYQYKLHTIFDGIDTSLWRPVENPSRRIAGWDLPRDKKIITYVSRGMEAMRGFDIFMKIAKRLCDARDDVVFVVVGEDRVAYGGDLRFTDGVNFKQWVLSQEEYDLERILFVGRIPPQQLAALFSLSDLHIYLAAPFVLSWSLLDAMACGATVLASDTAPVREIIRHGETGLLFDFFDVNRCGDS
jgi:glycosyltransferase involved in cell wall biosynthesis